MNTQIIAIVTQKGGVGKTQPDKLPFTLSDAMGRILTDQPVRPGEGILRHPEGVDLMPADIQLSGMKQGGFMTLTWRIYPSGRNSFGRVCRRYWPSFPNSPDRTVAPSAEGGTAFFAASLSAFSFLHQ